MKLAKSIFVYLLVLTTIGYFFQSCEKQTPIAENADLRVAENADLQIDWVMRSDYRTMEDYLEARNKQIEEYGIEYTVEYATLEEINAEMIKNGLQSFTEEDVKRAKARYICPPVSCQTWLNHGDWSGDFTLSTLDLVKANRYVCKHLAGGGCPYLGGAIDNIKVRYGNGAVIGQALDFAQLSDFNCEGGSDVLDNDDMLAARDYILGKITCINR